ncbi:MAG: calcium-binding protein, partial [Cyanobacteria bacterium J06629_9]
EPTPTPSPEPTPTPTPGSDPASFTYGADEQQLLLTNFDTANGWQLDRTQLVNGELVSKPGQEWTQAIYNLDSLSNLDLDNGDVSLYWRARADRTQPELAKFFVELDVVDKPPVDGHDEDREIKWNIRPVDPNSANAGSLPYLLYLDPGWQIPHEVESELQVPNEFLTPTTYENFRLTLSKTDADTVAVMPYYWADGDWQASVPKAGSTLPMQLSISENLEGRDFFDSLTVRFRQDLTAIDAFAITQTPTSESPMLPEAPPPRGLFFEESQLQAVQTAIQVDESHHAQAYDAIKQRVDSAIAMGNSGWQVYDENLSDNNWNYARAWLAREAAFLYSLTGEAQYAQTAYDALRQMYDDPDPDNRLPNRGYGLSRAATGMGLALAYDWAAEGWTSSQQEYIYDRLIEALDAWPSYSHSNFGAPYGSNWVGVSRGAETVMMLAASEETNRSERFNNLRRWLNGHLEDGYGEIGLSQEGNGYIAYAGGFVVPAVYALRNSGTATFTEGGTVKDVVNTFNDIEFWKLPTYTGVFDAEQTALQTGVGWLGYDPEGWTSLLLDSVSQTDLTSYQAFYDSYRGINNPAAAQDKFDQRRGGTVWSLLYYPTDSTGSDLNSQLPHGVQDNDKGAYFFRNRWQDSDDVLVSLLGDFERDRGWDQPEAFSLRLHGYGTYFFGGPDRQSDPKYQTKLLVDGQAGNDDYTGDRSGSSFDVTPTGGYAIVDGGDLYRNLGVDQAERHLLTDFSGNAGSALLSTLDRLSDGQSHTYTWQASLGTSQDQGGVTAVTTATESGVTTFLMRGQQDSYLKGWVLNPSNVTVSLADPNVADSPLQITTTASSTDIWVVMLVGTGAPPEANITGSGLDSQLTVGNTVVSFDSSSQQMVTQVVNNPLTAVVGTAEADSLVGNAGANSLLGLGGADILTGGSGYDAFVFQTPDEGGDTITDFGVDDVIQISALGFAAGLTAETTLVEISEGVFSAGATTAARFRYSGGLLSFDANGSGTALTPIAQLLGAPEISASQLQLVD